MHQREVVLFAPQPASRAALSGRRPGRSVACCAVLAALLGLNAPPATAQPRTNYFDDPFVEATNALPGCPVPRGPLYTTAEALAESHGRAERGTTCYLYGRCRLPNAYLYDKEIIPRVKQFIVMDRRFAASSIWLVGQRRWVYLQGCVASRAIADELVRQVRTIDDVESVVDQLMVGVDGIPSYATRDTPAK